MDASFNPDCAGLQMALAHLINRDGETQEWCPPRSLPERGIGERETVAMLAPLIIGGAARLGGPTSFAHMDPPTPWITWVTALWNAALNQNMLHPTTAPVAREIETLVVRWLAPMLGMDGGHFTAGSTLSNLTALWAAREVAGVQEVIASEASHLSIRKAANILGLRFRAAATLPNGTQRRLPPETDLSRAALVLTAGYTATGALDEMKRFGAAWVHVDAAWGGPMRLSPKLAARLEGIGCADSVALSAHKWLFQPKDSALIFFSDSKTAHDAISFGSGYLAEPNIGVQGSRAAACTSLLATLIAFGRAGLAERIEECVENAETLAAFVVSQKDLELFEPPAAGIVLWRPRGRDAMNVLQRLPHGSSSFANLSGDVWIRNVSANPNLDINLHIQAIKGIFAG